MRRHLPRFQGEAFSNNIKLATEVEKVASKKGVTPAQVAIAWTRYYSGKDGFPTIIPIPGATTDARVKENSTDVSLTDAEVAELEELLKTFTVEGGRYGGHLAALMNG